MKVYVIRQWSVGKALALQDCPSRESGSEWPTLPGQETAKQCHLVLYSSCCRVIQTDCRFKILEMGRTFFLRGHSLDSDMGRQQSVQTNADKVTVWSLRFPSFRFPVWSLLKGQLDRFVNGTKSWKLILCSECASCNKPFAWTCSLLEIVSWERLWAILVWRLASVWYKLFPCDDWCESLLSIVEFIGKVEDSLRKCRGNWLWIGLKDSLL
jgi:hypothetical protein